MKLEEPTFVEINMDAEIGSYQSDFPDPRLTAPPADERRDEDVAASEA